MPATKIAITVEKDIVKQIDRLVREGKYRSRSKAIQDALKGRLMDWRRKRLFEEVSKLDPKEEQDIAEESLHMEDEEWEKY
ncbi:MAG: ribbon-helix-helix protein, CopG family [Nitrospirae bacterium]|nr:ribbon-helix-helix protein, CopG family [Nitrospirota bacterium]